jgi:multidrug efflux pump subunit AcrA (membrane-fusion protein)
MKSLLLTFSFCALAALTLPSRAVAGTTDAPATAAAGESKEADAEISGWVRKLDDAKLRLEFAQRQLDELTNAKGRSAARRYPRGDAKAKYLDDLKNTRTEYEAAQRALPEVLEDARRAGIAPGVLEPYEVAAAAAGPAASADDGASDEVEIEDASDAEPASD